MPEPTSNRALAARRAFCDVSQRVLAYRTGISENRMWRIENGLAEATQEERDAIAVALTTTVGEVFPTAASASEVAS